MTRCRPHGSLLVLLLLPILALSCTKRSEDASPSAVGVLARYRGGSVDRADLDRAVLALPAKERLDLRIDDLEPFRELIRKLVFERLLLAEAERQGLDRNPALLAQMDGLRRQALAKSYIDKQLPAIEEPTDGELKEAYEKARSELDQPEKRSVMHIFLRRKGERKEEELVAALEQVRRRVLAGESFSLVAAELSDSESRHQQGFIGDISRGQLPPQLDKVIFSLAEKVPSQPIRSKDGVHLFFVEAIAPARKTTFAEARTLLRNQLVAEKRSKAVVALLSPLPAPPNSFVPTAHELEALLRAGDPEAQVLRYGEFEINLAQFLELVSKERQQLPPNQGSKLAARLPEHIFTALLQRERAYWAARAAGEELAESAAVELEKEKQERILERYRRQLLLELLDEEFGDRLKSFFADNQKRFASPLQLRLRFLTLRRGQEASRQMAELERVQGEVEAGRNGFPALAARLGGKVSELPWRTVDQLRMHDPKTSQFVGPLRQGEVSPPYTTANGELEIFEVLDRREPEILPFEKVTSAVRGAFLTQHGNEVYRRLIDKKLAEAGFAVDEKSLAATVESLIASKA